MIPVSSEDWAKTEGAREEQIKINNKAIYLFIFIYSAEIICKVNKKTQEILKNGQYVQ